MWWFMCACSAGCIGTLLQGTYFEKVKWMIYTTRVMTDSTNCSGRVCPNEGRACLVTVGERHACAPINKQECDELHDRFEIFHWCPKQMKRDPCDCKCDDTQTQGRTMAGHDGVFQTILNNQPTAAATLPLSTLTAGKKAVNSL